MSTATRWLRMYPLLVAWIAVAALQSLAWTAGIVAPVTVLSTFSGGLLRSWAIQHTSLSPLLAMIGPALLIYWLAKRAVPKLCDIKAWSEEDRNERLRLEAAIQAVPVIRLSVALMVTWFIVCWGAERAHPQFFRSVSPPVLWLLTFATWFLIDLRGVKKPRSARLGEPARV